MKLSRLIQELQALEVLGFGDRLVIDDSGNDVTEVWTPSSDDSRDEYGAVRLYCCIDYDLRGMS